MKDERGIRMGERRKGKKEGWKGKLMINPYTMRSGAGLE